MQIHDYPSFNSTGRQILTYIRRYVAAHGCAPSQREISEHCYLAQSSVRHQLKQLAAHGYITYERYASRGIRVVR